MYNVRHITFRRLWLFSGCLALLLTLMGLSLLLSTSSAHAAPVQGCKETIMKGANGQLTTITCAGEGPKTIEKGANGQPIPCVGGRETIMKGANGQLTTIQGCACVGGPETTIQGANGQRTTIQGCACVGEQEATVGESCPVLPSPVLSVRTAR
jgi:hypothetical protein